MKKLMVISAISGGILFWSLQLQANNVDCHKAETQQAINQCSQRDFQQKDEELNRLYMEYHTKLDNKRKSQLTQAQIIWVSFRDLSCQYEADYYEGGSLAPMIYSSCLKDKTKERIDDIKNYMAIY